MKKSVKGAIVFLLIIATASLQLEAQSQYNDFATMSGKLKLLSTEYPSACYLRSLTKTAGGKDIWVLTIGSGKKDDKPGIAVFGGVEGDHILGKELALGFASSLLKESSSKEIRELLDKITFYVFPDVSPDATEQYFSGLKYERNGNARSTDDDRDFVSDEDGYEDLNNDGLITLFRVADPSGKYIKSKEDDRIMVEADPGKGETGNYLVYSEGIDNDKDGSFNEDGPGGVDFNHNFSFNYEAFGQKAGMHPVSEPEAIAVADFLFDRFNIYAVFMFGPQDNLGQPMRSSGVVESDGVVTSIMKDDETINKLVSDRYHEITGVKGTPPEKAARGDFMDWAYFHYGRYSFSTPAWWISAEKGQNPEIAFMKYAESNHMGNIFVPWTEVSHPDFPGRKTEVGGIKPFVMTNPPADSLDNLTDKNFRFISAIASMHPELELLDIKTESAGEGIYRISLKVHNKGIFATCAKIGEDNMWTRIMRISLEPVKGQTILSGRKIQKVDRLEGDQSAEFSWLINGTGSVKVTAGALNTGTVSSIIELR